MQKRYFITYINAFVILLRAALSHLRPGVVVVESKCPVAHDEEDGDKRKNPVRDHGAGKKTNAVQ